MQPSRLTDSHRGKNNPHRGFEMMKTAHSGDRSKQNAWPRWRAVNPGQSSDRARSRDLGARIRGREPDRGVENASKCITAVDNAMTLT
jgi:hypothetical protein